MAQKPGTYTDQQKLNWEVEKLKAECRSLGRSFWTAVLLALFVIIGTVANIYFSQNQKVLSDAQKTLAEIQKENLDKEAAGLKAQNMKLLEEKDTLQADKASIIQEIHSLLPQLDAVKRKLFEGFATGIEATSVTPTTPSANLPARVYLQFLRSQESKVTPIVEELRRRGYLVFAKPVESSARRREIFVGYYYDTDKTEAEELLKVIRDLSLSPAITQPTLIRGGARQRHYDAWLAYPDA
jgi:hypothetical protein